MGLTTDGDGELWMAMGKCRRCRHFTFIDMFRPSVRACQKRLASESFAGTRVFNPSKVKCIT